MQKTQHRLGFFYKMAKKPKTEIFAFCVRTFEPIKIQTSSAPQNDRLNLSFEKDIKVFGKQTARNHPRMDFSQQQIWGN